MKKAKRYRMPSIKYYFGSTIIATPKRLKEILGNPDVDEEGDEWNNTSKEWVMETDEGELFIVFDWREYRTINDDEEIQWRITGKDREFTDKIAEELENLINNQ